MKIKLFTRKKDSPSKKRIKCRRKFLYYFPGGFTGAKYIDWERGYKWNAHLDWKEKLNEQEFTKLLRKKEYAEIVKRAVKIK